MKTIDEIHSENLKLLVSEFGGRDGLSSVSGKSPEQITQWVNRSKDSKTGNRRGMKSDTCRHFEDVCGKQRGWMDVDHSDGPPEKRRPKASNDHEIKQYHGTGGSMGDGVLLRDQPGQITGWRVTAEWAEKNIPSNTGKVNLCIVTGFGDSMRGMFNSGDPLIVDTGVKSVEFDAVYFFRVGNEGFIKRLQRIPGDGIRVISKNNEYETWTIKDDMDFEVFGRVLKVWNSENF